MSQKVVTLELCLSPQVRAPYNAFPVTYKYAIADASGSWMVEHGENRSISLPGVVVRLPSFVLWRHAGTPPMQGFMCLQLSLVASCWYVVVAEEAESRLPALICRDDSNFRHDVDWRGTGLACPVFGLRTRNSVGVGDFLDIKPLVDICSVAGNIVRPVC